MKQIGLLILLFGLTLNCCSQNNQSASVTDNHTEGLSLTESSDDIEEIRKLIRQVLEWADSNNAIDLLPVVTDISESVYVGFDLEKHPQNLETLKKTEFFAAEFIENYNWIILTLDRKMRDREFVEWRVGYLPPFIFASDQSPWCNCQDNLHWEKAEVKVNSLTSTQGNLIWNWGDLGPDYHLSWKEFEYEFKVIRENGKWKVSYMEGFDLATTKRSE